jgi:hypothetical protein
VELGDVELEDDFGVIDELSSSLPVELLSVSGFVMELSRLGVLLGLVLLELELLGLEVLERLKSDEERPVGASDESLLELRFSDERALLITWPSFTLVVCAIWPQPWPCERKVRMPGNCDEELAEAIRLVLVEVVPAAASGPPSSTAFHWSGVAQPVMPALRSASAARASVM